MEQMLQDSHGSLDFLVLLLGGKAAANLALEMASFLLPLLITLVDGFAKSFLVVTVTLTLLLGLELVEVEAALVDVGAAEDEVVFKVTVTAWDCDVV